MPSQTQGTAGRSSRLKRRAGTQQPIVDYTIPESAPDPSTQDMDPDIKEIYDQATSHRERDEPPPPKRARIASVDEAMPSNTPSREGTPVDALTQMNAELVTDGEDQLDFVEKTLKQAAKAKKEGRQASRILMPPPAELPSRTKKTDRTIRSPSEESEALEPPRKSKKTASPTTATQQKGKDKTKGSTQPISTQDTAFLTAIAKNAKSRRAVDELDKEFNQLRIPKPGQNPGSHVVKASAWNADHPDWNLVNDFNDEMRGNFIQIVKMDLMRKDGGRKQAETADDGRPNFKKFKKVSRHEAWLGSQADECRKTFRGESLCGWSWLIHRRMMPRWASVSPLVMCLHGCTAADVLAFWPTQQPTGKKGKGSTQAMLTQAMDEDDEDMPLLPRSRRRILDEDDLDDDISPMPPPASLAPRSRAARSAISETPAPTPPKKASATQSRARTQTQRQLRESSVVSDASSTGAGGRSTRTTRAPAASTQARKGKAPPIVIEESEDEVNRDLGPARSSTGTGTRTMGRHTSGAAGSGSGRVGDDEATPASASNRGKTQSSLGATGRRRLLVADDDDDGELVSAGFFDSGYEGEADQTGI